MATVTVDPNTSHQTFKRWDCTAQDGLVSWLTTGPSWHDDVLDNIVDFGVNGIRVEVWSGLIENTTDHFQNYATDGRDGSNLFGAGTNAHNSIWTAGTLYVPTNDDSDPDTITGSGFMFSSLDFQIDNFVLPMKQRLAERGESLFWRVCFVHFSASNQLHIDDPDEYGEFILAIWEHIEDTYGTDNLPPALDIFLEPDNTAAVTASELAAMIVSARDKLVGAGYAKPYIICPSTVSGPNARVMYLDIKSANATAASYIDEIGYHLYVGMDATSRGNLATTAATDSKNTAMTEYGGGSMNDLHEDLKTAKVSGWEQYTMAWPTGDSPTPGYQLFQIGSSPTFALTAENRAKYLEHYYKFVRANAVRKAASASGTGSSNVDALAFRNANGTYVVVIKCAAAVDFDIAGLPDGTYKVRKTIGNGTSAPSAYWQDPGDEVVSGGNTGTISMPGAGVVTIYNEAYLTPPETRGTPRIRNFLRFY